MPPASLDWCTNKNSIIFADPIAFVCFYDAQRVLSAIPINRFGLFIQLLKEVEERGEMREGEVDEERRGVWMWMGGKWEVYQK